MKSYKAKNGQEICIGDMWKVNDNNYCFVTGLRSEEAITFDVLEFMKDGRFQKNVLGFHMPCNVYTLVARADP